MILGECYPGESAEILFEAMKNDWSAEDEDTIQDLVVWIKQYKQTKTQVTGATATWDSDLGMYLLTIPAAYVPASGSFDIVVKGSDIDDVKIRLGVNTGDSAFLTLTQGINDIKGGEWSSVDSLNGIRSELTDIKGPTWTDETLVTIQAAAETGGTGTGGNEHVITGYTFVALTKTITISEVGYTTLAIEQIKFIYNITQGCEIYDRETPRKRTGGEAGLDITIVGADITFIETATMTNDDKLLIVVNV